MRVECYYTIEGKAVSNKPDAVYKPIGVWVLSGSDLLFKFLPGNEKEEWAARQALIRADQHYGKTRGIDHLRFIMRTASDYFSIHTIIKKTKKFSSASACIDTMLERVKKLAGQIP